MAIVNGLMRQRTASEATALMLSLLFLLPCAAQAAQFTVTSYYIAELQVSTYTYGDGFQRTFTDSSLVPITLRPSATIPAAAVSIETQPADAYMGGNIEVVQVFVSSGGIPESEYATVTSTRDYYYTQTDYTTTDYYETFIYTAPTYCATSFVAAVERVISLPPELTKDVSIQTASTTVTSYYGTTQTQVDATLATSFTPTGMALSSDYIFQRYLASCTNPYPYVTPSPQPSDGNSGGDGNNNAPTGGSGGTGGNDNAFGFDPDEDTCNSAWNDCGRLPYWGYIVATILPAAFLFGFVESYLWFGSMMQGHGALRFGTITWILLCLPVIFLTRHVPARSEADQTTFKEQWKGKKFGEKLSLWLHYGLRYKYPVHLLGVHPGYERGDPEAEDRLHKLYYDNSDVSTQQQMAYTGQQMHPAMTGRGLQQPALPPRTYNRRHPNSGQATRSVASESALESVPEEAGSHNVEHTAKTEAKTEPEPVSPVESSDPQPGRAPPEEPSIAPSSETSPTTKDNEDKA